MQVIKTNILTPLSVNNIILKKNVFVTISRGLISNISNKHSSAYLDCSDLVCIPGLIDAHVHLSQLYARGKHSTNLLSWLNNHIFSEELKSADESFAKQIARDFFNELLAAGTTTAVVYISPFKTACDLAFEVAESIGNRVIMGKTMMDRGEPGFLRENSDRSYQESVELFKKWNQATSRMEYIFSPRFALSCSPRLMRRTGEFASANDAYIQTHLSENPEEILQVRRLYPQAKNYTHVYEKHKLLTPKTLLGHAIHVNDDELTMIKNSGAGIVHCPDSNFFLKSGRFPLSEIKQKGIRYGLGSDVGAGTSLSMLHVMKMSNYIQNEIIVTPAEAFYNATLGNAELLQKNETLGSIETGKEADLTFLKIKTSSNHTKEGILSALLYLGEDIKVKKVYISGQLVFKPR